MRRGNFTGLFLLGGLLIEASLPTKALAQSGGPPSTGRPNRLAPAVSLGQLPTGRAWDGTTAVAAGADGTLH